MATKKKTAIELAQEHFDWLQSVLCEQRKMERRLFIDGMVHGYKHGYDAGYETARREFNPKINENVIVPIGHGVSSKLNQVNKK